ncbi:MAG: phosphate ABC transporter permease subunit PstC, partial [Prevotellaceae bacterium]|nr:phosphate ABC transporter permease subunit PstC [Prevotellaceae bacterium]
MKKLKKFAERLVEGIFTLSGGLTSLAILLIIIFLFKEGFGMFTHPSTEMGYVLALNADNPVKDLTSYEVKEIFDQKITNWNEVGGIDEKIVPFRFDEIFNYYSEAEMGVDFELLPPKIAEHIAANPAIIAFVPEKYFDTQSPQMAVLNVKNISFTEFFLGREWLPTSTPTAQFGVLPLILGTLMVSLVA